MRPARGSVISPRKSLRPNMSECHTVSHKVRFSKSDRDVVNYFIDTKMLRVSIASLLFTRKCNLPFYLQVFFKERRQGVFLDLCLPFAALGAVGQ